MSTQLQLRRGTTIENAAFTGAQGELTYNTETHSLKVHDGATVGGYGLPVLVAIQRPTAENGYTWGRLWSDGWVEQGGELESTSPSVSTTVILPVPMADTHYYVNCNHEYSSLEYNANCHLVSRAADSFVFAAQRGVNIWEVKGYAAQ